MRIAQVSALWERVPPPGYGGIELVVSYLADEMVRRGHEVTLFASGDSQTLARLESVVPQAIRLDPAVKEPAIYEMLQMQRVIDQADQFDIIHFHTGYAPLPFVQMLQTSVVHTLHGVFTSDNRKIFTQYQNQPFISISLAQRDPTVPLNYVGNVYNGIKSESYPFFASPQNPPYLAFLGRISPEKGPHQAIAIAKATGWKLKMAGKVDVVDRVFYEETIAPQIDGEQIEYLGEVSHAEKVDLIGQAAVTLFPITWPEPFGLVMVEAMCTGTPVLGMGLGSVPEVIANGKSGFVCQTVEEMIERVPDAIALDRQVCREHVLREFSIATMVSGYEAVYEQIVNQAISDNGRKRESMSLLMG